MSGYTISPYSFAMPEEEKKYQKKDEDKVVFKVDMCCDGCKEKVRKSIKGFPGLESIDINMEEQRVTVKGKVDAKKLLERMQKKCSKRTQLLFAPLRKEEDEKKEEKMELKGEEVIIHSILQILDSISTLSTTSFPTVTIVLKVKMHCGGCAREVKKTLEKMDGVCEVNVDMQGEKVIVKGRNIDAQKLCDKLKKCGKHAEIMPPRKDETKAEKKDENKEENEKNKEKKQEKVEKNMEKKEKKEKKQQDEKKDEGMAHKNEEKNQGKTDETETKMEEKKGREANGAKKGDVFKSDQIKRSENTPFKSVPEYAYPPQLFSDENPNACSIM